MCTLRLSSSHQRTLVRGRACCGCQLSRVVQDIVCSHVPATPSSSPEILTTVGLLYLRLGENYRAFDFLGNSLTHDPKNPKVGVCVCLWQQL